MAAAWRTRREELDILLHNVRETLHAGLSAQDRRAGRILECLNSDHPGELLDLLEYYVTRDEQKAPKG